jgi:transcriptional regulator with XRE-family HTH domain
MTHDELLELIQDRIEKLGSQLALAAELGVSPQYLSDVQCGRRSPGPKLLAALNLRRETVYFRERG